MNICKKYKIGFVAIPKTACSSIKHLFFELENGFNFQIFRANGKDYNVHTIYPSRYFKKGYRVSDYDDYFRFLIVRDPVKRFLSSYSNRVIYYKNLAPWTLSKEARDAGATPNPDLIGYVERLELYRAHSGHIRHHTDSVHTFTGKDLSWFDEVYPIEEMGRCAADLSRVCGQPITIPHEQSGGPKFQLSDLPPEHLAKVIDFYAEDYALLSKFYSPPKI